MALTEALSAGTTIDELYVDARTWAEAFGRAADDDPFIVTVDLAAAAGASVWSLSEGVLDSISDTVTPQGMLAVAPRRTVSIEQLAAAGGPVLVLVDVADPGNAGTLVRAAEASGAAGVVFAGTSTDAFGPKAVRSAAGSLLRLPVVEAPDAAGAIERLRQLGRTTLATVVAGGESPDLVDLTVPLAIVVGSEAHGLDSAIVACCDRTLTIPVAASVESLNVAVAGSVVLFEASRQRRSS